MPLPFSRISRDPEMRSHVGMILLEESRILYIELRSLASHRRNKESILQTRLLQILIVGHHALHAPCHLLGLLLAELNRPLLPLCLEIGLRERFLVPSITAGRLKITTKLLRFWGVVWTVVPLWRIQRFITKF